MEGLISFTGYTSPVMQYPTALRYLETILNPDGLFRSLPGLSSYLPPEYSSGAYGVVFRVEVQGRGLAASAASGLLAAAKLPLRSRVVAAVLSMPLSCSPGRW